MASLTPRTPRQRSVRTRDRVDMGLTVGSNASMTATTRKRDTSKRSVMSLAQDFENVQLAKEAIDMIKLTTSTSSNQGIKGSGSATTAAVSGRRSLFLDDDALADDSENVQGNGPLVSGKALYGFRTPQGSRLRKPADTKSEGLSLTARFESSIRRAASAKAPSSARQIAPGQMAKDSSDKDQDEAYNSGSDNDDDGEYSDGYVRQRFKAANNSEYDKDDDDGDDELNQYLVRANEDIYADEASGTGGTSYERYFHDLHASSGGSQRCKTSNNTLSKLPRLEPGEYRRLLAEQPLKHESQRQQLVLLHQQQFFQWFFELRSGFNVLFYGYGSKRELLNRFATTMLTDAPVLIVNGYFPSSNIRYVLSRIMDAVGDKEYFSTVSTSSVTDLAATIAAYFDDWQGRRLERLYLVIHNIDGPALRKETVQSVLGILACSSGIHIIASVDHINAPLMWDASILSHFNWCWHDLTTFAPYYVETSYENSTMMLKTQNVDVRGVVHVLSSLTSNAKSIFKVLVEHQLKIEEEDEDSPKGGSNGVGEGEEEAAALATNGLLFHTYYTRCRDAFLVSSELTFRSQLTEFRDHKIIQSKRMPDGSELLFTPLKSHQLRAILEQVDLG